jgi:hypothetical protein
LIYVRFHMDVLLRAASAKYRLFAYSSCAPLHEVVLSGYDNARWVS